MAKLLNWDEKSKFWDKCCVEQQTVGFNMGLGLYIRQATSSFLSTIKARACFVLIVVNTLLIVGIFVSASRGLSLPPEETNSSNVSTNGRPTPSEKMLLQSVKIKLPADIRDALMKVHRYMESEVPINATVGCQFAWKYNPADQSLDLYSCEF